MTALARFFSSLQLTVVLLTLSMALVFFGTLDQVHYGIWHTQRLYFESFIVFWAYLSNCHSTGRSHGSICRYLEATF